MTLCSDFLVQGTPLTNPNLIVFVDDSYCKDEKGISQLVMPLLPNMNYLEGGTSLSLH